MGTYLASFIIPEIVIYLFYYQDNILDIYLGTSEHHFYKNTCVIILQHSLGE